MTKRVMAICLCLMLLFTATAYGAVRAVPGKASLSFSGTTAQCSVTVRSPGQSINVTMELWCGNTRLKSWTKTGSSSVSLSKTAAAVSGKTYTLVVSGTAGGEPINVAPITKTCP